METKPRFPITTPRQTPMCHVSKPSGDNANNFECNICLHLAHDPVITLCGHLYCWPCLYKWLHIHPQSQDCRVCKTLITEHKLVPIYGCGKKLTNLRSNDEIPCRPTGQRPTIAPQIDMGYIGPREFGHGPRPGSYMASRYGNYTFASAFGGVIPWLHWDCES